MKDFTFHKANDELGTHTVTYFDVDKVKVVTDDAGRFDVTIDHASGIATLVKSTAGPSGVAWDTDFAEVEIDGKPSESVASVVELSESNN